MRLDLRWAWLTAGVLAGCAAGGAVVPAAPPAPSSQLGSPFADHTSPLTTGLVVLDRNDFRLGTTVEFHRVPTARELQDATQVAAVQRIVVVLAEWPRSYGDLQALDQVPAETECVVLLPGYPPTREAAEAWNLVSARLRLVVLADGPPPHTGVVEDLNLMRGLERVIATLANPARTGFERLQRPLSFRVIAD